MRPVGLVVVAGLVAACATGSASQPAASAPASAAASASDLASPSASTSAEEVDLTIFAAASLSGVLEKAKPGYEAAHPGTTLTISTDSSAALETQIEQGAPADVFLSADTTNPKKLVDAGLSAGEAVAFARNELAIVTPTDNPGGVATPRDLATAGLKVIAAGDEVPITRYATQLVQNLAKEPGYPADFEAAYTRNVVSKEDNVKAVIGKIELGEGDAAIVYVTDARGANVATVEVPESANVLATYAGVVVNASAHQEAARTFLGWLSGPDGQAVLASFGFMAPSA